MIRSTLCLFIIIVSVMALVPANSQNSPTGHSIFSLGPAPNEFSQDPDGTKVAFNATYSQFDLYTNTTSSLTLAPSIPMPGTNLTWYSRLDNQSGLPVLGTAFIYKAGTNVASTQAISWNLTIPQPLSGGATFVKFRWNGTLGAGTNATYTVSNGTTVVLGAKVFKAGPITFGGGSYLNATGGIPLTCASIDECIIVSPKYVGANLTLSFLFQSNSTGKGIAVQVENVMVATADPGPVQATSHSMGLKPSNSTEVEHTGKISLTYNSTVPYPRSNSTTTHTWGHMLVTFFIPVSYKIESIDIDGNYTLYPRPPGPHPLFTGPCGIQFCTSSQFITFHMTGSLDRGTGRIATIKTTSINAVKLIDPVLGGISTSFWMPGDTITVKMKAEPTVNASGTHTIALTGPSNFTPVNQTFNNKGGQYLYNVTIPTTAALGSWNLTGIFLNGYNYGRIIRPIRIEQIKTDSISASGTAGQGGTLKVQGTLSYLSNNTAAVGVNATVFVVGAGSPPGPISSTGSAASGLYISNITLNNGVFTQNQPLILFFSVVNPSPSTAFSANVTIEHEWFNGLGGTHGSTATFPLTLNDEPFLGTAFIYRADVNLSPSGVEITVRSVATNNKVSINLSAGVSGVPLSRQHFGLLKVSIDSKPNIGGSKTTNSLRSPTYAYVSYPQLIPSRLLGFSSTVETSSTGAFTATISADKILGAKNLAIFVLARNANGIVIGKDQTVTVADSTILTPDASVPSEVTVGQSVSVTLSLKSNSSTLPIAITITLDLSGTSIPLGTNTVSIKPGATNSTTFQFKAPSAAGSYLLTFSSQQYGTPLLTKTLQVTILSSALQFIIPAIVGLVVALVVLGVYAVRRRPETEMETDKQRPSAKPSKPNKGSSRNP